MEAICDICETKLKHKKDLVKHKNSETCKKIQYLLSKHIEFYKNIINEKTIQNTLLEKQLSDKDNIIKNLQEKSEEYRIIIEKAATKTTIKNNYTHTHNYLNLISSEPICFSNLKNQLKEVVNFESIMYNENEFHEHIVDNILRDENGKDKVLCTDINRKNFSYKDENSGELISDPELERLREQLRKGADIKILKKELLEKLVKKYENTNIDPYVKFYDILKKLDFGKPFVEHIAKKTYIKSISRPLDTKYETENNEI
jgi:hypothetical protein